MFEITKENGKFIAREYFNDKSLKGISTFDNYEKACRFACVPCDITNEPKELFSDQEVAPEVPEGTISQPNDVDFSTDTAPVEPEVAPEAPVVTEEVAPEAEVTPEVDVEPSVDGGASAQA